MSTYEAMIQHPNLQFPNTCTSYSIPLSSNFNPGAHAPADSWTCAARLVNDNVHHAQNVYAYFVNPSKIPNSDAKLNKPGINPKP